MILVILVQVMDAVGIIPENAEVGGGGVQACKTSYGFAGIGDAAGIGILGHAPNALDGGVIVDKSLDLVHIGAVFVHFNWNHFDTKMLGNAEVAIIAGNGAKELDVGAEAPGFIRFGQAVGHCAGNSVEHQVKAGSTANNDLFGLNT